MKIGPWPRDTIAWRFGATLVASMAATCLLAGLFLIFGGVWARPPLDVAVRLEEAASIIHIIETAPRTLRGRLSESARTDKHRLDWYAAASPVSTWLNGLHAQPDFSIPSTNITKFQKDINRAVVYLRPQDSIVASPDFPLRSSRSPDSYFMAVKMDDASWLVFTGFGRYWGLSREERTGLLLLFFILSFGAVSAIATRQLSRPIRRFATAVRHCGANPQSSKIPEEGPKELREVIAAFNEMRKQIREFVAYRTAMLAAISHDLRTPLTRMRLRGEYVEDEAQRERMFRDVDEMQAMIDGALSFFRGAEDDEQTRAFDLPGILQSIADDYADQGVAVGYSGPDHLVYAGRPLALKRAFTNLIENAVKYGTPPGVELFCRENAVFVTIRDNGPGLPADVMEKVFKPFYRFDKSRNRSTGGVGLGLTAALATVRGHGGDIVLRNRAVGGLEATVMLPLLS